MENRLICTWMFDRSKIEPKKLEQIKEFLEEHAEVFEYEFQHFTQIFTRDPSAEPGLVEFMERVLPEIEKRTQSGYNLPNKLLRSTGQESTTLH